jgi:hypothetical protein
MAKRIYANGFELMAINREFINLIRNILTIYMSHPNILWMALFYYIFLSKILDINRFFFIINYLFFWGGG